MFENTLNKKINIISQILTFILTLSLIIGLVYYLYKFTSFAIENLSKIDAVIIAALITGFISIVVFTFSKIFESRQESKRYIYGKKEAPYIDIIEMIYKVVANANEDKLSEKEMIEDIRKISKKISIWGSDNVIKKWHDFIKETRNDPKESLFKLEELILEIRKDLGQKDKLLVKGDMLRFFVNDLDDHLK